MGRLLLVAATCLEIKPLLGMFGLPSESAISCDPALYRGTESLDLLVTGVGQLQTAYHLGVALHEVRYSAAINIGIAGSFRAELPHCAVVQVVQEELADLGAEDGQEFLDLFELKLLRADAAPFRDKRLHSSSWTLESLAGIPKVRSITVNRVLGCDQSIAQMRARYDPDVVNMEGAAFFYSCGAAQVPSLAIRAISDIVGPRDKSSWDIPGSVRSVCTRAEKVIAELTTRLPSLPLQCVD